MSQFVQEFTQGAIVGEPEVVEDRTSVREVAEHPAWKRLKAAVVSFRALQTADGSIPDHADHATASEHLATILPAIAELAPFFPHDAAYLAALQRDFARWERDGFGVPDFLDALNAFQPQQHRIDGLGHLVVFPMVTQNGSSSRFVEAVLVEVIWPEFIAELEAGDYSNTLFVALRFVDFTPGYDTNSAVLFPETVAMREIPTFTWGAIFQDREAARYRRVVRAAAEITKLELPDDAAAMLDDQELTEQVFVMWDIIHDRSHMRGDLPFDPFMIKQRMPFFLYSLEELRCDLTAFRESVRLERALSAVPDADLDEAQRAIRDHAHLVQYAVVFDRIFRFAITGSRVRNYDGLGGQLLFAWMHQHDVLHWTDTQLTIDWDAVPDVIIALSDQINELYRRSIDRPKSAHWLAAYEMLTRTLTPHPASRWARGLPEETLAGMPKGYTDAVLDDEFPLSMFYEALNKKMAAVIASTAGITGSSSVAPPAAPSVPDVAA
ncbi:hypothetical protein EDF52_106249 [Curtobacterium sp. PhB42]|uniref:DUF6421 family protein n=1 Tax=unclassified Curtobacterium TaxID=257496 RepID=UPI001063608B|nr:MULTISPECIES: DUF6421 family protein [unclassified Curtobacterium]TDW47684.1 hypothetical protein EDF52_106249 [Curtobacterium sp. PhB42]TDW57552.1 hypothetical protein EDF47_102524 [Curtobacterium sp. PhB190]